MRSFHLPLNQEKSGSMSKFAATSIGIGHVGNIFKEGELEAISVCKDSLLTAADGKKYKTKFYNLDVIISVGYRVKSLRGMQFRPDNYREGQQSAKGLSAERACNKPPIRKS